MDKVFFCFLLFLFLVFNKVTWTAIRRNKPSTIFYALSAAVIIFYYIFLRKLNAPIFETLNLAGEYVFYDFVTRQPLNMIDVEMNVSCRKHGRTTKVDGGKIVGGYNTTIQQLPYQVYMIVQKPGNKYYQCGGSIIGPRHVLTAAHCLTGVIRVYIRAGSSDSDGGGKVYTTSLYTQHPRYNAVNSDYDVAVVRLLQKMTLDGTNTRAISLPASSTAVEPGTDILVSGWGTTTENGDTSRYLMAVTVPVVSTSECEKAYNNAITARMFCAGVQEGGKDSCQGDSGGPAVDESSGLQVGVVSFGRGCAQPGYPGVYTNVSNIRDFIRRQTGI